MDQQWIVYVDETGSFTVGGEPSYVVGWMTRLDKKSRLGTLEDEIGRVAPWLPRALHTTYLKKEAWHGVCLLAREDQRSSKWVDALPVRTEHLDALLRSLRTAWKDLDAYARAAQAIANGKEAEYNDLWALASVLPSGIHRLLVLIAQNALAKIQTIMHDHLAARDANDGGIIVLGGQSRTRDSAAGDRYLTALRAMVRSATWTLFERLPANTTASLEFAVASRAVHMPGYPAGGTLSSPMLNTVIQEALLDHRSLQDGDRSLTIKGGLVHDFRNTTLPGLFVADFAANHLYNRLKGCPNKPLDNVHAGIFHDVRIPMQFRADAPYAASATGWSWDALHRTLHGASPTPSPKSTYRWVLDATDQWAQRFHAPTWKEALL